MTWQSQKWLSKSVRIISGRHNRNLRIYSLSCMNQEKCQEHLFNTKWAKNFWSQTLTQLLKPKKSKFLKIFTLKSETKPNNSSTRRSHQKSTLHSKRDRRLIHTEKKTMKRKSKNMSFYTNKLSTRILLAKVQIWVLTKQTLKSSTIWCKFKKNICFQSQLTRNQSLLCQQNMFLKNDMIAQNFRRMSLCCRHILEFTKIRRLLKLQNLWRHLRM
jgi:hypothetical protein